MRKPTIYDIKRGHDGHFFDKKTLRFFNQAMKDFSVSLYRDGLNPLWLTEAPCPYGYSRHIWEQQGHNEFKLLGSKESFERLYVDSAL